MYLRVATEKGVYGDRLNAEVSHLGF